MTGNIADTPERRIDLAKPTLSSQRKLRFYVFLLIATFGPGWLCSSAYSSQQSDDPRTLAPGVPVEREISGGQSHIWQIFLYSGDYLRLSVERKRINIVAELLAPGQSRQSMEVAIFPRQYFFPAAKIPRHIFLPGASRS